MSKDRILKTVSDYVIITLGLLMYVTAWALFLIPHNLMGGGVSGISAIVYYATGLPMGVTSLILNGLLLAVAFFVLGHGFGFKTIYAILFSAAGLTFLPGLIPEGIVQTFAIANGKMLSTIIGGVMTGVGIGLAMSRGGSTGGTDIVALMINKYRNVSPGRLLLEMDVVIMLSSLFVPSYLPDGSLADTTTKIATVIYALIMVGVNSYSIDLLLTGSKQTVQVFIFSRLFDKIADALAYDLHRGVTIIHSKGWYSKQDSEVIVVVARKTDLSMLLRYVKGIDQSAFITINSCMGVYGKGFDTIKEKPRAAQKISSQPGEPSSQNVADSKNN